MESMGDENWRESFNLPKQQPQFNQSKSLRSPTSKNGGWWKRTSQNVADWITSNESHAVPENQNSQKKKQPQQRKRTLRGSNRYRASF